MNLVVTYTAGDGYTWHSDITAPLEYESEEAFAVDFEEAVKDAKAKHVREIHFAGHCWEVQYFFGPYDSIFESRYYGPTIQTLEDWFEDNKVSTAYN